jgi:hypothetical protein
VVEQINGTEGSLRCDDFIVPWHASPLAFPENPSYDERSHFTVTPAKRPWEKTNVEVEPCLAVTTPSPQALVPRS